MEDRYIREYWFQEDLSDGLIQLFADAKKAGMTVQGMVGDGESPTGNVLPDKKKSEEISFEDIWNGELGPDVWGCRKYMDFITDCYSDYWEHFVLPPPIGIKTLPQIQYYQPGEGYFYPHIDAEALVKDRVLVYITYLNDCPDGGTIMVNNDGFTIHAQKGKTVIFPAGITHKHVGEISQTHEKYICTGWVEWLR